MESLLAEGVDTVFGYPGGSNLPMYDALPQYPQLRHVLVRHEQAAAHAADAYARDHRQGGRLLGHVRPRRDEPGHRHRQRLDGLCADGLHYRLRGQLADRPRRLPGSRHYRHYDPDYEAQHAGAQRRGHRHRDQGSVPHRDDGPSRSRSGRHPARHPAAGSRVQIPRRRQPARLPAADRGRPASDQTRRSADRRVGAARDPCRTRRHHLARLGRAGPPGRDGADPGDHHAAGHRRLPGHARA